MIAADLRSGLTSGGPSWWPSPAGPARVIVPIDAPNALLAEAQARIVAETDADMVEWRADYLEPTPETVHGAKVARLEQPARLVALAATLRVLVAPKPLIFTWRTISEGGRADSEQDAQYEAVMEAVINAHAAGLVDIEIRHPASLRLIALAGAAGVPVIGSWHDTVGTPPEQDIVEILTLIEEAGADVAKAAVTARYEDDVTTLMSATATRSAVASRPIFTMAMGQMGLVSRVLGYIFGSQATFATVVGTTAPGQPDLTELRRLWAAGA